MKIGLFVDVGNLYYCCGKKFHKKVNYEKLLAKIKELGDVVRAVAYGSQKEQEAKGFISCLKFMGFEVKFKAPKIATVGEKQLRLISWNVDIALDIIKSLDRYDKVVICSADANLAPLVAYIRERGLQCTIVAIGVSKELKITATNFIELEEGIAE